jgi:putative FmdB family regulatory protein
MMPIYEYVCGSCERTVDVLQKVSDPPPEKCEQCGAQGALTRKVSRTSFVLKGGGWYSDLYSSVKKDSGSGSDKGGSGSTGGTSSGGTSSGGTSSGGTSSGGTSSGGTSGTGSSTATAAAPTR